MRTIRTRNAPRRATTVVEMALIAPIVLLLVFGILEYGRFLMTRQVLEHAAREGARYAVVHTYDKTTVNIQDVTFGALSGLDSQLEGFNKTSDIQVYRAAANGSPVNPGNTWDHASNNWKDALFGELVAVRVTGKYKPILPSFLFMVVDASGTIPIQVTSVMYSEAN
ncbi:MAG TPA: TadE/TadG family type IV pilus assembly protein [Gemmataceae bacterium]|nr:TadE/TadG family type IV pilus assembly protein [Gemmataceae bacterium]